MNFFIRSRHIRCVHCSLLLKVLWLNRAVHCSYRRSAVSIFFCINTWFKLHLDQYSALVSTSLATSRFMLASTLRHSTDNCSLVASSNTEMVYKGQIQCIFTLNCAVASIFSASTFYHTVDKYSTASFSILTPVKAPQMHIAPQSNSQIFCINTATVN